MAGRMQLLRWTGAGWGSSEVGEGGGEGGRECKALWPRRFVGARLGHVGGCGAGSESLGAVGCVHGLHFLACASLQGVK